MGSSFFGLNIGQQGLYTAQTNLNITSHNIANAETEGFSRQYGVQSATTPLSNGTRGMIGTGSEITTVSQHRDAYLDDKYWDMSNEMGEYEKRDELLGQIELILNEPSDTGYSAFFNDIFDSLQTLATNPSDLTARSAYVDNMSSFSTYLNDVGSQLSDVQSDANFGVAVSVDQINYYAQQLATLNGQIGNLELTGDTANDLRDERNRILDDLSKVVNVDITELKNSYDKETLRVSINGQVLVDDTSANYLETRPRETLDNPEDSVDLYDIYWTSGRELYFNHESLSGELKGYLDIRDGNNGANFTGTTSFATGDLTLTVDDLSRTDLPQAGDLEVGGSVMRYSSYNVNAAGDAIEFTLEDPAPIDVLDGQVSIGEDIGFKGVPYYLDQLNEFVRTLAIEFNTLNESGNGGTGVPIFTFEGYTGTTDLETSDPISYEAITIHNFMVNEDLLDDPGLIENTSAVGGGESANDLLLAAIDKRHDENMFNQGEPDDFIASLVGELGIDAKQTEVLMRGQENLVQLIENQRLSVSGVDVNEETTNLLKYQSAYNLAAHVISVMNEIYDVTINSMGL